MDTLTALPGHRSPPRPLAAACIALMLGTTAPIWATARRPAHGWETEPMTTVTTRSTRCRSPIGALAACIAITLMTACGGGGTDQGAATPDSTGTESTASSSPAAGVTTSSTSPSAAPDDPTDPCRLLTPAEAEAALGRAVSAPVSREFELPGAGHGFDCLYPATNQDAGPASVHAGVLGDQVPRDGWEQAERDQAGLQEVAGVGELAFFDEHNQTIDVFDHGRWIQVQMINTTRHSELLALLTDMARNAVERV